MTAGILPLLLALSNEAPLSSVQNAFNDFSAQYLYGDATAQLRDTCTFESEYDFIVIGAGTGGCVMANRLTENPRWNVLLLEAGRGENLMLSIPLTATAYTTSAGYYWKYQALSPGTACMSQPNGACSMIKGRGVGGTSLHNYMFYTRGHQRDFDGWAEDGNYGWSYQEVLPYFLKGEKSYLKISQIPKTELGAALIAAGKELGYSEIDPKDGTRLGFCSTLATTWRGQRYSAARDYIHPIRDRPNLFVSMNSHVTKILINPLTRSTYGVEFMKNGVLHSIRARKEVILSAGAINSPQILMLSGIGPKRHLESLSIPVIKSLDVGYNLHDHYAYLNLLFTLNQSVELNPAEVSATTWNEYLASSIGVLSYPQFPITAFVKNPFADSPEDYPDIEMTFQSPTLSMQNTDTAVSLLGITQTLQESSLLSSTANGQFIVACTVEHPKSRGKISLNSSNHFDPPEIQLNYFSDPNDLESMIVAINISIQLGESRSLAKFGSRLARTPVPGCEILPFGSDDYWKCTIRQLDTITAHSGGTCKMGPRSEPTAVVDPELRVHGVRNLRVVDASVIPSPITGHPNGVVFMIGEKAADLVKSRWGC